MQKKCSLIIIISVFLLVLFGIIMIYSSSYIWAEYKFNDPYKYLKQQVLFAIIGFIIMFLFRKIDYKFYYKKANLILLICIILLILVIIPGIGVIRNGSRSWFGIGPFGIQPSEAAKLGLIIFVSKYLSNNKKAPKDFFKGILPILGIVMLVFLLIMLQPDFGTGFILVMSIIAIIFISGANMKYFYILGSIGIIGVIALIIVAPYRMDRITSFLNPWKDPLGTGFQIIQSLYAIGPGGLLGLGFTNSIQKHFYLPEPQTDFIFSIICEEFGIIGPIIVVTLFLTLTFSVLKLVLKETNLFKKYLMFGIIFQMIFQTILNLSVVIGLIPVTGVTLPFLSYGGSSLLVSMASIGMILSMAEKEESV